MLKPFPNLMSDEEAEDFVATADLSEYDWTTLERVYSNSTANGSLSIYRVPDGASVQHEQRKAASDRTEEKTLPARPVTMHRTAGRRG